MYFYGSGWKTMDPEHKSSGVKGQKLAPRDAKVMAAILQEMGVSDYDPKVINQMLEFLHSMCLLCLSLVVCEGKEGSGRAMCVCVF